MSSQQRSSNHVKYIFTVLFLISMIFLYFFFFLSSFFYVSRVSHTCFLFVGPITRSQPLILGCRVDADSGTVSSTSNAFDKFVFFDIKSVYRLPSLEQPVNKVGKPAPHLTSQPSRSA